MTLVAIGIVVLLTVLSILAPVISSAFGVNYTSTEIPDKFLPIGAPGHLLGTDDLGRDQLSRLLYAGQVSLSIGFVSAILSLVIGVSLGVVTGYYGGIVDDITNWVITTLNSIPSLFLLLIIFAVSRDPNSIIPQSTVTLIVVLGLLGWTSTTRLVRGETLSLREREYIISARAIGASSSRIMFSHIVPNLISILVVTLAIDIGILILVESSLSFLGFGVRPPTPSWGNMLTEASSFFTKGAHLVVLPGLLITVTVLCLYVIGDGLRDAFDPTSKD
ncbi:MAG: ABC transporter permease [Burkholderiales bacterium]|nr:ABC transporter permease [Anaerolineae bacterium]